jgi:hypothetical protein
MCVCVLVCVAVTIKNNSGVNGCYTTVTTSTVIQCMQRLSAYQSDVP